MHKTCATRQRILKKHNTKIIPRKFYKDIYAQIFHATIQSIAWCYQRSICIFIKDRYLWQLHNHLKRARGILELQPLNKNINEV